MKLLAPLVAALLFAGTGIAHADAPTPLTGAVKLSNCSGSIIRLTDSEDESPALLLTNGHCVAAGNPAPTKPAPNVAVINFPTVRDASVLDAAGNEIIKLQTTKLIYGTRTGTDIGIYQLNRTYGQLDDLNVPIFDLAEDRPEQGATIDVLSGYWKSVYSCKIDGFVYAIHEGGTVKNDAVRYTPECKTIHGTSGSPVVDRESGEIVAINSTGYDDSGEPCSLNNPCEVDENGTVTIRKNTNYAMQTYWIHDCVADSELVLDAPGCKLFNPNK
ncbi:serine protease [Pseudonocardiaceae bacterium YIM PH 21723]|nr:serine protease [Pseudonocardiaceae bacterium YIM PH 21723]